MQTVVCRFADIAVRINYIYPQFKQFVGGYTLPDTSPCDLQITVTEQDIEREKSLTAQGTCVSPEYLQTLAVYRAFCTAAAKMGVLLFHGSAMCAGGNAFIFAAPSGTGKSTHAALWRNVYGDKVRTINDDKPLLRFTDSGIYVYGTPWNGKHRLGENISAPLKGLCFLERAQRNAIRPLSQREGFPRVITQTFLPSDGNAQAALEMASRLAGEVPLWLLSCNISEEAARLSYTTLTEGIK